MNFGSYKIYKLIFVVVDKFGLSEQKLEDEQIDIFNNNF